MPSRIANDNNDVEVVRGGGGVASGVDDTDTNPPTLSTSISAIDKSPPVPPPNVPPIQLKMWLTIIQRRKKQISKLSNTYLLSFANDIILDLLASQENDNDEQDQNKENSEDQVLTNPLLITGYYSTYLLMVYPPPSNISIDDVILHLLALFYRSVDERLTSALNCVRRAFTKLDEWSKKFKNKDVVAAAPTATENGEMDTSSDGKIDESKKRKSKDISSSTSDPQQNMGDGDNREESGLKNPTETNTDGSDMSISSVDNSPRKEVRKEDEPQKLVAAEQEKELSSQSQKSIANANSTTDSRKEGRFENGKEVHNKVPRKPGIVQRAVVPQPAAEPAVASRKRPPEELAAANLPQQKKASLTSLRAVDPISQQGAQEQQTNEGGTSSNDKADSPFAKELNAFTKQVEAAKTNESSVDDHNFNNKLLRRPEATLFIQNIPGNTTEEDMRALFEPHGLKTNNKVIGITLFLEKGYGFVDFDGPEAVAGIIEEATNSMIKDPWSGRNAKSTFMVHGCVLEVERKVPKQREVAASSDADDNPLHCKVCNITCSGERQMQQHLRGRKHAECLSGRIHCELCNVTCLTELNFQQHLCGKKHREMMKKMEMASPSTPATTNTISQRFVPPSKVSTKNCSPQQNQVCELNQGVDQQAASTNQQKETSSLAPEVAPTQPEVTTQDVSSNQSTSLVGGTKVSEKVGDGNVSLAAVEKNKQQPVITSTQSTQAPSNQQLSKTLNGSTTSTPSNSSSKDNTTTWRRRVIRKCTVDNCPNKGGKCDQHGPMVKTCSVPDCMKVPQHGGLCASHGGKRDVNKAKKPDATTVSTMKTTPKKTDTPVDTPAGTSTTATTNTKMAAASATYAKTNTNASKPASSNANTKAAAKTVTTTPNASTVSSSRGNTSPVPNNNTNDILDNSNARDVYEKVAAKAKSRRESAEPGHQNVALAASNAEEGKEPEMNDDVIDLTEDSPSHESPSDVETHPASVVAASTTLNRNQAIKEDDIRSSNSPSPPPPPPPPSPPASPIPPPIIHDLPPPSMPQPKPFMDNRKVVFLADRNPVFTSGNLQQRNSCTVEYDTGYHLDGSGSCCYDAHYIDAGERLKTWDPYWKVVEQIGSRQVQARAGETNKVTFVGAETTSCRSDFNQINSCTSIRVDLPMAVKQSNISNKDSKSRNMPPYRAWGVKWGNIPHPNKDKRYFESGDRRLIVRTIPLQRTEKDKKKQADGHLWPKGTFMQLKRQSMNEQVLPLTQRKQQSHDHQKWTGQCYPLDLTNEIVNTSLPFELKLCCNEIVENASTNNTQGGTLQGSYVLHVAICEYISPNDLYDQLMGKKPGDVIIPRISLRSSKKMAKEYLASQMVSMIDSDDEDVTAESHHQNSQSEHLSLSLLCSVSRTVIETPVRGRHCKHIQCFDLKNFLHSNSNLNGGRWRCLVCESFLNVRDLVHCGLFQNMLDSVAGQVSSARDKVKWHSDGTWRLQEENRLKYSTNSQRKKASNQDVTDMTNDDEVIELL